MTNGQSLVNVALAEVGTKATGKNKTDCKYTRWYFGTAADRPQSTAAWCAIFIEWCMDKIGCSKLLMDGRKTASAITLMHWFQSEGRFFQDHSHAKPGDIVFFDFNNNSIADHVGIFVNHYGQVQVETIDGNTSSSSQSSGGTVARKRRSRSNVLGYGRIDWGVGSIISETELETLITEYQKKKGAEGPSNWLHNDVIRTLKEYGISDCTRPHALATREEVMQMCFNVMAILLTK